MVLGSEKEVAVVDGQFSERWTVTLVGEQSSRFAAQATLGADMEEIERIDRIGPEGWLDEQLALPASSHLDELRRLQTDYGVAGSQEADRSPLFRRFAWWNRVMGAPDLLRQRVALALSEIFVVSDTMDLLFIHPESVASYYDTLLEHAFGSYEELLLAVTLHPAMGVYLSHLNNDRSDVAAGRFPDENYAREVMQLFSIGLFELERDGKRTSPSSRRSSPASASRDRAPRSAATRAIARCPWSCTRAITSPGSRSC